MPWKETCVMDLKIQFVADYLSGDHTISNLARGYGVSRKTAYKWIQRYEAEGASGLESRSSAPGSSPQSTPDALVQRIVDCKHRHLDFGPKKIIDYLERKHPDIRWPAASTCGDILKRAGLVKPRRRRRPIPADASPFSAINASNDCWSADFKGDFRLQNGSRCYPLTITDNSSRYFLQCRGFERINYQDTRDWFEWTFHEYGLPDRIRTDNGVPFASRAVGGLSRLSKWWIDLGIKLERSRPGKPTDNARHERMHLSLKEAECRSPAYSLSLQQERFDAYRHKYNELRSHEGLGRQTPASQYQPSERKYTGLILPPEYDSNMITRTIKRSGELRWNGGTIYLSEIIAKSTIGLLQIEEQRYEMFYRTHSLGILNEARMKIEPATQWHGSKK